LIDGVGIMDGDIDVKMKSEIDCITLMVKNHGIIKSSNHQIMESRNHGIIESWNHGITESRNHGITE
jgi:hypothetical protein